MVTVIGMSIGLVVVVFELVVVDLLQAIKTEKIKNTLKAADPIFEFKI